MVREHGSPERGSRGSGRGGHRTATCARDGTAGAREHIQRDLFAATGDGRLPALRSSGGGEITTLSPEDMQRCLSPHLITSRSFPARIETEEHRYNDTNRSVFDTDSVSLRTVFAVLALVATVVSVASSAATPPLVQQIGKRLP